MGKTTKTFLYLGLVLVLLVGGRFIVSATHQEDDKTLIQKALADSIQASREGRPGGVMDKLSTHIKYNGQDEGGASRDIARYIRESKPEIEVQNIEPVISGDEATIVSPVDLTMSLIGNSITKHMKEVTLVFRKENDREWLVIPTRRWKLAEVQVPDTAVTDLGQ